MGYRYQSGWIECDHPGCHAEAVTSDGSSGAYCEQHKKDSKPDIAAIRKRDAAKQASQAIDSIQWFIDHEAKLNRIDLELWQATLKRLIAIITPTEEED